MITDILQRKIDNRREMVNAGITPHHQVKGDGYLDHMAERFIGLRIREYTHITFARYLESPEDFELAAKILKGGGALHLVVDKPGKVSVPWRAS